MNQPLSRRGWNQTAANALAEDPVLFAGGGQNNDFHVVYSRLPQDRLLLGQERPVVTQLLREHPYALFIFSNQPQDYWHFINVKYDTETEKRRLFRRISISPEERLRTAAERISMLDLQSIQPDMFGLQPLTIQSKHDEAFDVEAVTRQFFDEYKAIYRILENDLCDQTNDRSWAHDYSLQFLNRCMFIYFIQRKGWLGNDRDFLPSFWKSYQRSGQSRDSFVDNWLKVLFFEAFNNKFHGGHNYFPAEIEEALSLAPYLNGGLFTENRLDQEHKAAISDRRFEQVFKFLERYNFTIAEDSPLDKEVAVDPEMIGKVYESLVNIQDDVDARGEAGIYYTPRTEIDLMCRLALVDHLSNHLGEDKKSLLYQLVFALEVDEKVEADHVVSKENLWPALNEHLQDITVLDPACGSGSFLVGMLNILDDLRERANRQFGIAEASYERKKRIIGQSLYGVDVMEWACHVTELRLWLALIIDAEFTREELHVRREPLLPYFSFKIRCGDSLVQEVGGINLGRIAASQEIPPPLKARITTLKDEKLKFYNNDKTGKFHSVEALKNEEKRLFSDILDARQHRIQERIKALRRKLEGPQTYQIDLDGKGAPRPHQMDLEANKSRQEIEALTIGLSQTEASEKAISTAKEVPFVWDIAFVEIFESEKAGFGIVMGNPPYVRQEAIADPHLPRDKVTVENKRAYKDKLARSVYQAFPRFFGYKAGSNTVAHKIDAKSDLYIYFYLHGLSLLNGKGSFCFITSNSWLDVGYGADLQEFLLKHSHVKLVLDNQVRRTFANADVNSIIVLFSAPDDRHEWALEKTARFVMFRVPFEHILSPVIFDEIEEATERKATKEYRVFPIPQEKLLEDGCELPEEEEAAKASGPLIKVARYIGNKWGGKYLRAPDIYWTILEKGKGRLVRLGDVAEVRRGFTTGANEFFYLDEEKIQEWGIEEEFLKPVIKSPRECKHILIDPSDLKYKLFMCHKDKKELEGTAAVEYIKWGESRRFHKRPTCIGRLRWWQSGLENANSLFVKEANDTSAVFYNPEKYPVDCRLYCADLPSTLFLFLNSPIAAMMFEIYNRAGLGEGARSLMVSDYADVPCLSSPHLEEETRRIIEEISTLPARKLRLPVGEEWRHLDLFIFEALNLTHGECDAVYEAVIQLVEARLKKADSV
ncbi:MAG: hypothetical protein D4R82_02885 [Dehalococcoidia bacterium]|nr:MAG: hypothetical protein D4R82_02885 [Dehalococcoidia bacterium]